MKSSGVPDRFKQLVAILLDRSETSSSTVPSYRKELLPNREGEVPTELSQAFCSAAASFSG